MSAGATVTWTIADDPTVTPPPVTPPPALAPAPAATPEPEPEPSFTATVGDQRISNNGKRSGSATVTGEGRRIDIGCKTTGTELRACEVALYAKVGGRRVLVGKGKAKAKVKAKAGKRTVTLHAALSATGRALRHRARRRLRRQQALPDPPRPQSRPGRAGLPHSAWRQGHLQAGHPRRHQAAR